MLTNPLFPNTSEEDDKKPGLDPFREIRRHDKTIEPLHDDIKSEVNPAANLIREKLSNLYRKEPNAKQEILEVEEVPKPQSKHQQFMLELSTSGKSLAEIQTAWHNYYIGLPDNEKHEVWQEFYANNANGHYQQYVTENQPKEEKHQDKVATNTVGINPNSSGIVVADHTPAEESKPLKEDHRTVADVKRQIAGRVNANGKLTVKHHVQSVLFGLSMGLIAVIITLFSFFNEYIIAPFIQPSRNASATPIIIGAGGVAASSTPEVIIPKINVEAPLNFSATSIDENQIENALQDGVVHYPTTVMPGQTGNTAFFGHSSNNILNPGHYKFVFTLLHELVPGDTFYLTYGGKVYAYQVFQKEVVSPNDVSVLNNVSGKTATATLITCDPPGTSINRLIIWGEQVSPDPVANIAGTNTSATTTSHTELPGNGPTLWTRMVRGIESWF